MGLLRLLLLTVAFLIEVAAGSTSTNAEMIRFLRFDNTTDGGNDNGERGINMNAIRNFFKPKAKVDQNSLVDEKKLEQWLFNGTPADKVFKLMDLDMVEDNLLANPQFYVWVKYLNDWNKRAPGKETSVASVLTTNFGNSRLSTMLDEAIKVPSTKALPVELQLQRLGKWKRLGVSPGEVFDILRFRDYNTSCTECCMYTLQYSIVV